MLDREGFHKRGFTSLWLFFSFAVMVFTGAVLYMGPQGRVAYWTDWHFLGLTKTHWTNIHMVNALAFAGIGIYHLILNWKVFTSYLVTKATDAMEYKLELSLAAGLTFMLAVGAVFSVPPISYVEEFGEYLKSGWVEGKDYEPPFGHAEQLSLATFSKKMDIPLETAAAELRAKGIKILGVHEKLEDIARANRTSSMELYRLIKQFEPTPDVTETVYTPELVEETFAGTGLGRKALPWVVQDLGLNPVSVRARMVSNGIRISDTETLKQAAERYGIEPIDILKIALVDGYTPKIQ